MTGVSELSLLWLAAAMHPQDDLRAAAREYVAKLPTGSGRTPGSDLIASAIGSTAGTQLEPFLVTSDDVATACELAAFALREPEAGLQIVSRDKLRPVGGLLVSQPGEDRVETRYLEQFGPNASSAPDPSKTWRFSPGHRPAPAELSTHVPVVRATVSATDSGFGFTIGPLTPAWLPASSELPSQSELMATGERLDRLGFKVTARRDGNSMWTQIGGGSAEGLIRISAAMAGREWLLVGLPGAGSWLRAVAIRLDLPSHEGETALPVVRVLGDQTFQRIDDWLQIPPDANTAPVPMSLRLALEAWIGIPPAWATLPYLEERP